MFAFYMLNMLKIYIHSRLSTADFSLFLVASATTAIHSALSFGSSLYSLGANPTENITSNNPSTAVMGGWLAIDVFTGRYQAVHVSSRDCCITTVPHFKIFCEEYDLQKSFIVQLLQCFSQTHKDG
jgi:hypothetical protein